MGVASGLRVVEVGESTAAALAGMVLADFGADVTVVEPPDGTRLRQLPAWRMWSRGKRTTCLELTDADGRAAFDALVADADVAVVALEPATADRLGVDAARLTALNPRLVHCEITGFGRGHPLSHVAGHEGVVAGRGGRAAEFSVLFAGERPAFPAVPVTSYGAAMLALHGVFAALVERERTGVGQAVATSLLRALSVFDLSTWTPASDRVLRVPEAPMLFYLVGRTRDGVWVQFSQNAPRLFAALLRALELEHVTDDPRFRTAPHIADLDDARALRAILLARVGERTWDEWRPVFVADPDISAEPFRWPGEALDHPQLRHTGDAREVDGTRQLGPLATFAPGPAAAARNSPPRNPTLDDTGPLLRGVTVLEMATWIATPMATALLAELGARVIKIEPLEGDPMRRYGQTAMKTVQGKESITLDLKTDAGREIVHRLASRADVFVHNYRPGAPERLGIDAATLQALNARLVHVYAASYGSTGPMSGLPAFHVTAGAICGGAHAQIGADGPPAPDVVLSDDELAWWSNRLTRANEPNPDFNAALALAAATTMAVYAARRTGDGQQVETRMMASNAYALSEHFVDYPGRPPRRFPDAQLFGLGARYRLYEAAQGWVFLAAPSDADAARLAKALGTDDLGEESLAARFRTRDAATWERDLTAQGVACVQVHDGTHASYIFDAPWAQPLGFVATSAATGSGPYLRYGRSVQTASDPGPLGSSDAAGAHTAGILAELGYADDEIASLRTTGVIGG